jgi:hypothetical protein
MLRARVIAVAFVLGLLATLTATAQPNPVQPTHLALEVYFYPGEPPAYIAVSPANVPPGGCWFARFKRVPGWTAPAGSQEVHAVNIQAILVGDVVKVSVSVFLGLKFEEERDVAVYTLHEGDKITLRELAEFGVEPLDIVLVRVASVPSGLPQFVSKVKSIELVTIQNALSTLPAYRLALRNLSTKNVSALVIKVRQGDRTLQTGMPQGKEGRPLVVASGVSELIVPAPTSASATPAGYQPTTSANQIIEITEAAFDDGTSEGELGPASRYGLLIKSRKIQLGKVIDLFQTALQDDSSAPQSALDRFENQMAVLDPKGAMRDEVIREIHRFRVSNPNLDSNTYHAWLVASKQKYEAWLARL